jgi:hypothetical protein
MASQAGKSKSALPRGKSPNIHRDMDVILRAFDDGAVHLNRSDQPVLRAG